MLHRQFWHSVGYLLTNLLALSVCKQFFKFSVVIGFLVQSGFLQLINNFTQILADLLLVFDEMRKKKVMFEGTDDAKNSSICTGNSKRDTGSLIRDEAVTAVEKTPTLLWFLCLIGVSLLSLITRLYNLHQPPCVWSV